MPEPVTMGAGYLVFTGAVAVGGVITGYFMRKEAEKDERRRAERQRMRREAQQRDARAREAANEVAVRIGHDADAIVTRMREKQQQFSGLITSLNTAIVSHQHSTDELQGIITTMQDNLTDLINPNNGFCCLNTHIFQRNRLFFCRKRSWWTLIYQIFHCKDEMIWVCTS